MMAAADRPAPGAPARRVLVAGVGNLLRRDDGFGVVVAQRLAERDDLPPDARVIETGIGGVALVQELMDGYDAVLVLDAVRRGGAPGTLYLLEPDLPDLQTWSPERRHTFLADLHQVEPSGALVLAGALGVLPPIVRILGCEPADCDLAEIGLTPAVARAADLAVERVRQLLEELATDPSVGALGAPPASAGAARRAPTGLF
jgi:hydrogenase maturation protease